MKKHSVFIIHVGNMKNRGTQALISADVDVIKNYFNGNVKISVSTTDVQGVKNLNLPVDHITPPLIDIPFERSDSFFRKINYTKRGFTYIIITIFNLLVMFLQSFLSILSVLLLRIGLFPIYRANNFRIMVESDIIVSCSDENLKEGSTVLPLNLNWLISWWTILFSRTLEISIAKFLNKRVVMFPNSVGPFRTPVGIFLAKLALNHCEAILAREPISLSILKQLGVSSRLYLTSDSALLYDPPMLSLDENEKQSLIIGVSPGFYTHILSDEKQINYIKSHAEALDKSVDKFDVDIIFLPHYVSGFAFDDLYVSEKIYSNMKHKERAKIIKTKSLREFKTRLKSFDMHISSKMHPTILATSSYIPTLSIVYDHKQIGYYELLNLKHYLLDITNINDALLFSKIDALWNNRSIIKEMLKEEIKKYQESTLNTIESVLKENIGG